MIPESMYGKRGCKLNVYSVAVSRTKDVPKTNTSGEVTGPRSDS